MKTTAFTLERKHIRKMLIRPELWIIFLFVIRWVGITNPPLETGHNWRQCTGLMVARNFYETDGNILFPRMNETEGKADVFGMEFPSMNYAHALMAKVWGYRHWYGRLINLIVSTLGLWMFVLLLRRLRFDEHMVLASVLALGCSIWFSFSRKTMPDTYCISLAFVALYFASCYFDNGHWWQLVLYVLFGALAVLSKIPAGIWFVLLVPVLLMKTIPSKRRIILAVATLLPVAVSVWWYFIWCPHLSVEYGHWYNLGKSFSEGVSDVKSHLPETLDNFYFDAFCGFVFFGVFLFGIIMAFVRKQYRLLMGFALVFAVFVLYIFKSGFFFYHHNYYSIPIAPAMAAMTGYGLTQMPKRWMTWVLLFAGCVEGVANQQHDFFIRDNQLYKMRLEEVADKVSKRNDLIMVNGNGNPQWIYLAHRKGWIYNDDDLSDTVYVEKAGQNGCRYIFVDLHVYPDLALDKTLVYKDDDFVVYATGF